MQWIQVRLIDQGQVSTLHRISSAGGSETHRKSCGFQETRAGQMAQQVKELAAKPNEFNLWNQMAEGNKLTPESILTPKHMLWRVCPYIHIHKMVCLLYPTLLTD